MQIILIINDLLNLLSLTNIKEIIAHKQCFISYPCISTIDNVKELLEHMIDVPKIGCNISKHMYINLFITSCVCAWYLLVSIIHLALSANCVQLVYTELSAVIVYQVWRYGIWAKWPKFFLCKTSITFLFLCISRLKGRVISHKIYNL